MPEIKNNFLQGKMNKDLDDRLLPNGQYRDAQNITVYLNLKILTLEPFKI